MIELIYGDCLNIIPCMKEESVDLTVTSPPYDNLRTYNDSLEWGPHIWKPVIEQLFRLTKQGGGVVWVVGDATIKGSETGTSFKQALYFKEVGFNLHDTMIYQKKNFAPYDPKCKRYYQEFEYMFVFSKGKIKTCNYIKVPCIHSGEHAGGYSRSQNGELRIDRKEKNKNLIIKTEKIKANIWQYANTNKHGHPAIFPEKLAHDHIVSWSNPGDLVFDPFMGSGTTGKMSKLNGRNFFGIEKDYEYFSVAQERINQVWL